MKSVNILGVEVSDLSFSEALARVQNFLSGEYQHYITTPNPEIALLSLKDENLRFILNNSDLSIADGFGLKIAALILGKKISNRITGVDFMESIVCLSETTKDSIFILGGEQEKIAEQAAWRLKHKYNDANIVGYASGGKVFYEKNKWETSDKSVINQINSSKASILFVGFGAPKQEKWIFSNLDKIPNIKLAMSVGGSIDFFAGIKQRAPIFLRKLGLEWAWRLVKEPSRALRIWNATAVFLWTVLNWRIRMMFYYRNNVAVCILDKDNNVLIVKRAMEKDEHWQLPQGGVDKGENIRSAAFRETKEEVGLENLEIIAECDETYKYDWPEWHKLNGGYKGQFQTLFFLRYNGNKEDVKIDNREIIGYKWIPIENLVSSVHKRRKNLARIAFMEWRKINV